MRKEVIKIPRARCFLGATLILASKAATAQTLFLEAGMNKLAGGRWTAVMTKGIDAGLTQAR